MSITIKELTPYLGYNITVENLCYKHLKKLSQYSVLSGVRFKSDDKCLYYTKGSHFGMKIEHCKPVLRPLEDLINSIQHNGESFVPIIELTKLSKLNRLPSEDHKVYGDIYNDKAYIDDYRGIYGYEWTIMELMPDVEGYEEDHGFYYKDRSFWYQRLDTDVFGVVLNQYELMQKLFEWHFDVFGLIEKGLAADFNKVNPIIQ